MNMLCIFFLISFSFCLGKIKSLLPRAERYRMTDFLTYATSVASEFTTYIYRNLAPLMITSDAFKKISSVKWESIQTIQSKHNPYVDTILQVLTNSKNKLEQLGTKNTHIHHDISTYM